MLAMQEKYWTPKEIAERFKLSEGAIRKFIRQGKLEAVRLGTSLRVSETALQEFIDSQKKK